MHFGGIIIIGLFLLGKWLVENMGKWSSGQEDASADSQPAETPPDRSCQPLPGSESEEERMRRFMEALGLPPGSVPPSKPAQRPSAAAPMPEVQPLPRRVVIPAAREQRRQEPAHDRRQIAPPSAPIDAQSAIPKTASVGESVAQMEVSTIPAMTFATPESYVQQAEPVRTAGTKPAVPGPSGGQPLRAQLWDKGALRKALILREILGPPKALQSAKTHSIFSPL